MQRRNKRLLGDKSNTGKIIRNSKSEIRNNVQMIKQRKIQNQAVSNFVIGILNLFRILRHGSGQVSILGFRIFPLVSMYG
jgi:hypothetical protein